MKALQPVVAGLSLTLLFAAGLLPHGAPTATEPMLAPVALETAATPATSLVSPETPQEELKDLTF